MAVGRNILLDLYGSGYEPNLGGDSAYEPTTVDVRNRVLALYSGPGGALRSLRDMIPESGRTLEPRGAGESLPSYWKRLLDASSILDMTRGGLNTAANWIQGAPEIGPDTLAPLGLVGLGLGRLPVQMASKNAMLFEPPTKPQRPFAADYPQGAPADAAGRLTHDIEGRPLVAEHVVGRRVVGQPEETITPAQLIASAEGQLGARIETGPARALPRGAVGAYRVTRTPDGPERRIRLSDSLSEAQTPPTAAHEIAHLIDDLAGEIPTKGLSRELGQVYHDLNDASWRRGQPTRAGLQTSPKSFGYAADKIPREYMAEAIRAYLADPNYIKTVAPKTAARIREYVNSNSRLANTIQFNADQAKSSVPGTVINSMDDGRSLSRLLPAAAPEPQDIRAYHGSPHDFDKFDASRIGTGEGAQAYGHGLYFAENEGVARGYKNALAQSTVTLDGEPIKRGSLGNSWLENELSSGTFSSASQFRNVPAYKALASDPIVQDAFKKLKELEASGLKFDNTGRIYEVSIKAHPDELIDFLKPLSQQSRAVQDTLKHLRDTNQISAESYRSVEAGLAPINKGDVKALSDAGIKGVIYDDQLSRGAAEGAKKTRNYVVFSDRDVEILKKYGWVPIAAVGGGMMMSPPGEDTNQLLGLMQ